MLIFTAQIDTLLSQCMQLQGCSTYQVTMNNEYSSKTQTLWQKLETCRNNFSSVKINVDVTYLFYIAALKCVFQ